MKKLETIEIYQQRIVAAVDYINLHLDEELELADIARVANFSPYHFHRIFKAFRGEPLGSYITRLRVETAAQLLGQGGGSVEEIAYSVGFGAPASLSKAFRQFYGVTPTGYRSTQKILIMKTTQKNPLIALKAPKVVELEAKTIIYIPFTGEYSGINFGVAYSKLWGQIKVQKLFTAGIESVAVYYNDPHLTEKSNLRTDVGLVIRKPAVPTGEVRVGTVAGGRYAVFTHVGPYNELGAVYDAIYGEWVPANCDCGDDCACGDDCRCALRDAPVFEKYCNDPAKTAPEKLETEIYVPIK